MKLIIAGSRHINLNSDDLLNCIEELDIYELGDITEVVSGGASGIDASGEQLARDYCTPITRFIPKWEEFGKAAGPIRNRQMAEYADALLLIWDGKSRGSYSILCEMNKLHKPIYTVIVQVSN
jgi:hypothetical protein